MGKYEQSIASFEKASFFDPFEDDYYYEMARAYYALGQPAQAYAGLDKGISRNPVDPYIYQRVADFSRITVGDNQKAIQYYRKTVELKPDYNWGWYILGWTYHDKLGDDVAAEKAYLKAIEVSADGKWWRRS